jgi:hypothetical protein
MTKARSALGLSSLAFALAFASHAAAELPRVGPSPTQLQPTSPLQRMATIALECSGSGASDVVHRHHSIKNATGHTVPKGTVVHWTSSDKGSGSLTLTADLANGGSVDVTEAGQTNGYTCTASFLPGAPDLIVRSVHWTSATDAQVEIQDLNPWTAAGATVVRVQSLKCLSTPVASVDVAVPAILKGGTTTVTAHIAHAGADYLQATANATNAIGESNKTNNVNRSPDFGSNKSCTPQ